MFTVKWSDRTEKIHPRSWHDTRSCANSTNGKMIQSGQILKMSQNRPSGPQNKSVSCCFFCDLPSGPSRQLKRCSRKGSLQQNVVVSQINSLNNWFGMGGWKMISAWCTQMYKKLIGLCEHPVQRAVKTSACILLWILSDLQNSYSFSK